MPDKVNPEAKESLAKKPTAVAVEKAKEQLNRKLGKDSEAASYCCEAAFAVRVEELPSEAAFD